MKDHFLRLFAFNSWANDQVLEALSNQSVSDEIRSKMSHILWAEWAWLCRIKGIPIDKSSVKNHLTNEELAEKALENGRAWRKILESNPDFETIFEYKLMNGTESRSCLADIITHVVNHGSYHRGQIATLLRQERIDTKTNGFYRIYEVVTLGFSDF
jgi:uncharacterized damage-inducible protein DinB